MGQTMYGQPYKKGEEWLIDILDSEGNPKDKPKKFKTEKDANTFAEGKVKEFINKAKGILDDGSLSVQDMLGLNLDTPEDKEEMEKKRLELKTEYDAEEDKAENEAKELLVAVANLYLDKNIINESDYLKFKSGIEVKGLSSLIFQLNVSRKAIFKLTEEIHLGKTHPRHFEVLAGLQRVVLDISKFLQEHVGNIEKSIKGMRDDESMPTNTINAEAIDISASNLISNKETMLKEVEEMLNDIKNKNLIPKSLNPSLEDTNPTVVSENIKTHEMNKNKEMFDTIEKNNETDNDEYGIGSFNK